MDLNIGKDEEDAEEEQSPLANFKLFNDKFKRVELLAKHLLAIPATSIPFECLAKLASTFNSFLKN